MKPPVTVSADGEPTGGGDAGGGTGGHSIREDLVLGGVAGLPGGSGGREADASGFGSGSGTEPREEELMAPITLVARGGTMEGCEGISEAELLPAEEGALESAERFDG